MKRILVSLSVILCLSSASFAAEKFGFARAPSVEVAPVPPVVVSRSKPARVQLSFRVQRGFHINSNRPKDESLIPTALRLSAPTDVLIGRISYPAGRDMSFEFLPGEKLNVYEGDFAIGALVTTSQTIPYGTYRVHGSLKYQACDNRQCYPPKDVPVQFDLKVQKPASRKSRGNPAQSPHIHR